jgi:alkylation response protein AidB-like acyl-CoA dehydrogenase
MIRLMDQVTAPPADLDGDAILANVRSLEPLLREHVEESERQRQLVPEVVDALSAAGVFRLSMPRSWGGPEVDPVRQMEIVEVLSHAYGSAGWCAAIGSAGGLLSRIFPDEVARRIWYDIDLPFAGWIVPAGRLVPDSSGTGYRLSGRWSFGSGSTHAEVFGSGALLWDPEANAPALGPDGAPQVLAAVVPAKEVTVVDTWRTTGLAGSGSHDYTMDNVFVPNDHVGKMLGGKSFHSGALYAFDGFVNVVALGVPLGIARYAVDSATSILKDKVVHMAGTRAKDDPRVRTAVARAEAMVRASRAYCYEAVGDLWETVRAGDKPSLSQRAALAGSYTFTFQSCRDAVQMLYDVGGSASVYQSNPLDRSLRDLITICQHMIGQARLYDTVGQMWLGDDPGAGLPF